MSLPGHITPFQHFTNRQTELSHLRVFGSHVTVKQPRVRRNKLDTKYTTTGIFLGFTLTNQNIWFEDSTTSEFKSARHAVFDEAYYSSNNQPPYARQLMSIAEEHLANLSSISPTVSTLPLHIITDETDNAATNPTILPSPPGTSSHR